MALMAEIAAKEKHKKKLSDKRCTAFEIGEALQHKKCTGAGVLCVNGIGYGFRAGHKSYRVLYGQGLCVVENKSSR